MLDALFAPLALGPVTLANRIVSTSHQTTLVADHLPTDDFVAYQEARAAGGAGLIICEAVAVAPSGLLTAHTLGGYVDGIVDGYRRVAAAVQPHGCRLFAQLFHGGREQIASAPRPPAVSASALPSARYHTEPRALSTDEVAELVAAYGRCASLAAQAGLDGVEVTAAHGYLGEQFFDPATNLRTDRYGEPTAFLAEVLDAVRAAAPGLALSLRVSADSPPALAAARALHERVDVLHLAVGNSATFDGCVGIAPPPPAPRNLIAPLVAPFRLGPPIIATTRITDPVSAAALVAEGSADAVGMTRALIADPSMPRRVRAGETYVRCIGCNACIAHYHAETPIRCAINPRAGNERSLPWPRRRIHRRRVVVIGAGPAGCAAAAEAAAAGDEVVVLEARDRIGGQIALAGAAPGHAESAEALAANYAERLHRPEVELRMDTPADPEAIAALPADAIMVATGARPAAPRAPLHGATVLQAWDVLAGERPAGGARVLIADWGGDSAGMDCAELLAAAGHAVTLAVGAVHAGQTLHQYMRNQYLARLARAGVGILPGLGLDGADGASVRLRNVFAPELCIERPADALVVSLGRVPERALGEALAAEGLPVVFAGDCASPRGLEEAILEGTRSVTR